MITDIFEFAENQHVATATTNSRNCRCCFMWNLGALQPLSDSCPAFHVVELESVNFSEHTMNFGGPKEYYYISTSPKTVAMM